MVRAGWNNKTLVPSEITDVPPLHVIYESDLALSVCDIMSLSKDSCVCLFMFFPF